ncbi:MAG TPA: TonB family protein [Pyrinomonadaceae bacterium]
MSSAVFKSELLMFGELLAHLRQHGFGIGLDHYLRLQQLLDRIGGQCSPRELRTLLCPIFATSKAQQEQFYRAFDSYFDIFQVPEEPEAEEESLTEAATGQALALEPKSWHRKWLYATVPVALAAIIFALVLLLRPKTVEQPAATQAKTEADRNIAPEANSDTSAATATPRTETIGVTETPAQPSEAQTETPTPTLAPSVQPTPEPTPQQSFYERNRISINVAIILSPLVLFLFYEWYRFARRKLLLQRQQSRKPPFAWPIRVDAPEGGLYDSEQFLTAARLMRRRQIDEFRRLDVEATVSATIERLGFPDFRYRSDSRVPEYLILIDRASYKDHQARLFDELTLALEREGVFVVRYFFEGDPRVCRDERGTTVMQLTELQNRLSTHRLLIFGNGEKLLDPISGRLDSWTAIFSHWQDRALLTVESTAQWGLREIALAQAFIVLPATLKGLLALVDYFETTVPEDLRAWVRGGGDAPRLETTPEETVRELRRLLGEETFQWLAACAVYTELQWNLTLFIGSLPSMPPGLVTEANLLKLIRLPWFRTGVIPDEVRWLLINELTPERQKAVRASLIELLEKDPAPPETFASDQYRLNLFTQRWLQSRTRKRLRELMQIMKELPRSQVVRDLTLVRFLESSKRSPLDFLLPDRLRKLFYHRGVPAFGLKTGARFLFTLFLVGAAWIGIKAVAPKATPNNPLPDMLSQSFGPASIPTSPNSETTPPPGTVPTPESMATPSVEDSPTTANSSPVSSPVTTAPPTNSNSTQTQGTLTSTPIERGVTSVPPVVGEQPSGNPEVTPKEDVLTAAKKAGAEADQLASQKRYDEASLKYREAIILYEKGGDKDGEAVVLNNLGTLYANMQRYDEAITLYKKSLELKAGTGNLAGQAVVYNNLGFVYLTLKRYDEALMFYQKALEIKRQIGDRAGEATVLNSTGRVYELMGDRQKAQYYYDRARSLQGSDRASSQAEAPQPKTTPTPEAKPNAPVSVGSLNSRAINLPKPDYPPQAAAARASGTVVVQAIVDETGKVISAKAISGHPLLREPTVKAAYRARFKPTILSGQPVQVIGTINYNFVIEDTPRPDGQGPEQRPPGRQPNPRPPGRQPGGRNP